MQAISRQPLTKTLIQRKVFQALGMATLIIIAVTVGGLLILRIF
jgi:hypothetical protein